MYIQIIQASSGQNHVNKLDETALVLWEKDCKVKITFVDGEVATGKVTGIYMDPDERDGMEYISFEWDGRGGEYALFADEIESLEEIL